jgi:hypothetical protein
MSAKAPAARQPTEVNQIAAMIASQATDDEGGRSLIPEKNPAAVALGRLGGMKGGKARAAAMTPERRAEIARMAAAARWSKSK